MRPIVLFLAAVLVTPALAQTAAEPPMPGEYRVIDGRVDRGTYFGWRVFHSACLGCHGFGATGTDIAPNLLERVRTMTPRTFEVKVLYGYPRMPSRSRLICLAWDDDDTVKPHVLNLYAYLMARADGKLGPGQPRLLAQEPLKNP